MKNLSRGLALCAAIGITAVTQAATVTVEPDDYTGIVSYAGPGATLATVRYDDAGGWTATYAYSVKGGDWAPTGSRVFGHRPIYPGNLTYHWDYLGNFGGAYGCIITNVCNTMFFVLGVTFTSPTKMVEVLTTMRGEMAMDPVELAVYNTSGNRILRCRVPGVDQAVVNSGVLPPPKYFNPMQPWLQTPCGEVIEKKNCSGSYPGNCDYVVKMRVEREIADISLVMFGGLLYQNTHANVDKLSYWVP